MFSPGYMLALHEINKENIRNKSNIKILIPHETPIAKVRRIKQFNVRI